MVKGYKSDTEIHKFQQELLYKTKVFCRNVYSLRKEIQQQKTVVLLLSKDIYTSEIM